VESVVNRRLLIVADAVVLGLCALAAAANFVLGEPGNIVAGVSALVVGACAATTMFLLVTSGGWSRRVRTSNGIGTPNGSRATEHESSMPQDA
jgi:hypothetical protein